MIQPLIELLQREAAAADKVAARTRAVELIAAAGERRFLGMALDELENATERLSGLELARSLALVSAGLSVDISATELVRSVGDPADRIMLERAVDELRQASDRLHDARERATVAISRAAASMRARLQAVEAFAAV